MDNLWQFLTTLGGVDDCHIPLNCRHGGNEARKEYYNFKNFYSVVIMGIASADYQFLWASAGLPETVNNVCSFQACKLYQDINNGEKLPEIYKTKKKHSNPSLNIKRLCLSTSHMATKISITSVSQIKSL